MGYVVRLTRMLQPVRVLTVWDDWWHVVTLHVMKVNGHHSGNLESQINWISQIGWVTQFIVLATKPQLTIVLETRPRASPAQTLGLDCRYHESTPGGKKSWAWTMLGHQVYGQERTERAVLSCTLHQGGALDGYRLALKHNLFNRSSLCFLSLLFQHSQMAAFYRHQLLLRVSSNTNRDGSRTLFPINVDMRLPPTHRSSANVIIRYCHLHVLASL
jgi:hypothetical protein